MELTTTKENLKNFIERWEEHPNSPYVFDASSSLILPVYDIDKNTSSGFSSRGCSPSPCESLSSNTELFKNGISSATDLLDTEVDTEVDRNTSNKQQSPKEIFNRPSSSTPTNRQNKEYLQSFDRRHSDSNYVVSSNSRSNLEKIDLAEEIKKLSERLMMLSSINDELLEYNKRVNDNQKSKASIKSSTKDASSTETKKNIKNIKISETFSKSMTESSSVSIKKSTKEKVLTHSKSLFSNGSTESSESKSVVSDLTQRLKSLDETPSLFKKVVNARSNISANEKIAKISSSTIGERFQYTTSNQSASSSSSTSPFTGDGYAGCSAPWPITNRRTKFRVNQLSRDVPVGSPNSHQTIFLEEAANTTKDCLLHLLEKYNGKEPRSGSSIRRHQSISVGYGITDNIEYNSMNSINAFFKRNAFQHKGTTVKKIQARIESKAKQ